MRGASVTVQSDQRQSVKGGGSPRVCKGKFFAEGDEWRGRGRGERRRRREGEGEKEQEKEQELAVNLEGEGRGATEGWREGWGWGVEGSDCTRRGGRETRRL